MRALSYAIDEATASIWRGRKSGALSIATITTALFVLGGFLLVTANLDRLSAEWSLAAGISVYLDDGVTPESRAAIERALAPGEIVAGYEPISKDAALRRFRETFSDLAATIDTLGSNPLPASYEVRLQPSPYARANVETLGDRLRRVPGVADVRFDRDWLDRLSSAVAIIRTVGFALAAVLAGAAALTVANVVRLALHARRDEIEIMELVGAPASYVRGPFIVEGILQGGAGSLAALALLGVSFLALRVPYLTPLAAALGLPAIRFLTLMPAAVLVVGGMAVGCLGGVVAAVRRGPST